MTCSFASQMVTMPKMTVILALAFLMGSVGVQAQTYKNASVQTKAKPKSVKTKAPVKAEPVTPMGSDELAIADRVHQGHLACELGATVRLDADVSQPGYFYLHSKGFRYRMHPVATTTGAIRLEDRKAGAVWLQLANKSMLMDQNKGRRLADECANPEQMAFAENMKTNPPPSLIDTTGTGR